MSDLISRSALIEALQKEEKECEDCMIMPSWYSAMKVIREQPTAYDVDKVVEELEELISMFEENNSQIRYERYCKANRKCKAMDCFTCVLSHAIEIVKGGGVNGR